MKSPCAVSLLVALGLAGAGCAGLARVPQSETRDAQREMIGSTPLPGDEGLQLQLSPLALNPRSRYGLLYVSDHQAVHIFPLTGPNQKKVGQLEAGIHGEWGLGIDHENALYVANTKGNVTVYPYGSSHPSMRYSKGPQVPLYALPDSVGHVFVSGRSGGIPTGTGMVIEYAVGKNVPIAKATLGVEADGLAENQEGDLFVAYRDGRRASIAEFGPGLTHKGKTGIVLDEPQGLLIDHAGNIIVVESFAARIDVFPPGTSKPSVSLTISGIGNLAELAMQDRESTLWVSSEGGDVYSMPYPLTASTVATQYDVVKSDGNGVAVTR